MSRDYSRKEVLEIIETRAHEHGIPRDDFLRFAYIETGGQFDELASRGPNGAKGLFQFVPTTAQRYGIGGRELDPVANTDAAARLYLDNRRDIVTDHARTGRPYLSDDREPRGVDMYMAHQQGAAGYRSIQAALAEGTFSRSDTRPHILNNVSRRDVEAVTGVSFAEFSHMSDLDMARTFVKYWDTKFDRIHIPEMGIEPGGQRTSRLPQHPVDDVSAHPHAVAASSPAMHHHAAARSAMADGSLRFGESGPQVRALQTTLTQLGYTDAHGRPIKVDGDFGQYTREALQAFQRDHHLDSHGTYGPKTQAALHAAEASLVTSRLNPHHALYERTLEKVREAEHARGTPIGPHSERIAAALTVELVRDGIGRIDRVEFNASHTLVRGVQVSPVRDESGLNRGTDAISARQASTQPITESSRQLHEVAVNAQAQRQDPQFAQLRPHASPTPALSH